MLTLSLYVWVGVSGRCLWDIGYVDLLGCSIESIEIPLVKAKDVT